MQIKRVLGIITLCLALGSPLAACSPAPVAQLGPNQPQPGAGQSTTSVTVKNFNLLTHCGIHELGYGDRWFIRDGGMLDDGSGNPPDGWDNPTQQGKLVIDGDNATFQDAKGHNETFTVVPDQTEPSIMCS